jgi:hypothetical protein
MASARASAGIATDRYSTASSAVAALALRAALSRRRTPGFERFSLGAPAALGLSTER